MDMEQVAPMIVAIVLIVAVTGTVIVRPLAKHLAGLLEVMARERAGGVPRLDEQLSQLRDVIQTQGERLALLEERLEFTESLVRRKDRALPGSGSDPAAGG